MVFMKLRVSLRKEIRQMVNNAVEMFLRGGMR
jgi:hypothetical protein